MALLHYYVREMVAGLVIFALVFVLVTIAGAVLLFVTEAILQITNLHRVTYKLLRQHIHTNMLHSGPR
jgi:hypothetical protein